MNRFKLLGALIIFGFVFSACQQQGIVHNLDEFNRAVENAQPGDEIVLANGVWENAELLFEGKGTAEAPISLKAQEKGKVFLEGESNLRLAGEFLYVDGLVFRNGYTPTWEVISFQKDDGVYAYNSKVSECVVDNFNNEDRFERETWVSLYGQNNTVENCSFIDKRTAGVTMIVRLIDEECRNNNHTIRNNYFGFRQNLGSNGGETLRIGTSHYSLTNSGTLVENNYFDKCGGEVEIVSNKSCGNQFKYNTFFECKGTLTFRHGNDNIAEGNFFFGNGVDHSGGIRLINKRNKAINNYLYGLKGYRLRSAMAIMNGVPNSPINRYHQVDGAEIKNNTFIDCDHIQFCSGSDAERSAVPINTVIENNLFLHSNSENIFTVFDDISGIEFKNNYIQGSLKPLKGKDFEVVDADLKEVSTGVYAPDDEALANIGCTLKEPKATKENTGALWYAKKDHELQFNSGNTIIVQPGVNTLYNAIIASKSGDVLVLEESGDYKITKKARIVHPLTIKAASDNVKAVLKSSKSAVFYIENSGALKLQGLEFDGRYSPDKAGNAIVSTSKYSMNRNYKLIVEDCKVLNLDINHSFDFLKVYKNTMADSIVIRNCQFENITGNVLALDKETEELGIYNAEYVVLENNTFKDIQKTVLNLLRGGTDESTSGPNLTINNCQFENIGHGKRNKIKAAICLHGVQVTNISNLTFSNSEAFKMHLTLNGEPITVIKDVTFKDSKGIVSNSDQYKKEGIVKL